MRERVVVMGVLGALVWGAPALASGAPALLPIPMAEPAPTEPSEAQAPSTSETSRLLVVEVDPATLDAEELQRWVQEAGAEVLAARNELPGPDAEIRLRIEGQTFNYRATVELRRRGEPLTEQPEPLSCQCSSDELLQTLAPVIDTAATALIDAQKKEAAAAKPEPEPTPMPVVAPPEPVPVERRTHRLGPAGTVGTVLAGTGAATLIAGVVMAAIGQRSLTSPDYADRDWRPPGYTAIAVGSVLLGGGAIILVANAIRCRRGAAGCR